MDPSEKDKNKFVGGEIYVKNGQIEWFDNASMLFTKRTSPEFAKFMAKIQQIVGKEFISREAPYDYDNEISKEVCRKWIKEPNVSDSQSNLRFIE